MHTYFGCKCSVLLFLGGSGNDVDEAIRVLNLVTGPYTSKHRDDINSLVIFYTIGSKENEQLYDLLDLPRTRIFRRCPTPLLVAINFVENHGYVCQAEQLDINTVNAFFTSYLTETLPEDQKRALQLSAVKMKSHDIPQVPCSGLNGDLHVL